MRTLPILIAAALSIVSSPGYALTGGPAPGSASPSTLKLPDKPGSVKGLSDEASANVFSGQVNYSVPLDLPAGPAGFGPSITLSYSGDLGNGPLGVGWTLGSIAIRRSTRDGVPTYTAADELELTGVGGGGRLVADSCTAGRYWVEGKGHAVRVDRRGSGWEILDENGVLYRLGQTDESVVQAPGTTGTHQAAWFVGEVEDVSRLQRITFRYDRDQNQLYLREVSWGPIAQTPLYKLKLSRQSRPDVTVSWATGFEIKTAQRMFDLAVEVFAGSGYHTLRRYRLAYDDRTTRPDLMLSRLRNVTMTGREDQGEILSLPPLDFTYLARGNAERGQLQRTDGWRLNERGVTVLDVDGDGMADLARLEMGNHQWRKNRGGVLDAPRPLPGAMHTDLESVRLMDLDGDARPELVTIVDDTWRVYKLVGSRNEFRWEARGKWPGTEGVALHDPAIVFADLNGDGSTDIIEGAAGSIRVRLGSPRGLGPVFRRPQLVANSADVEPGVPNARFADQNGDGLADLFYLTDESLRVYLGRGDGTFVPFRVAAYPWDRVAFDDQDIHLVDLDRDGLVDLVRFTAGHAVWFPGKTDGTFDREQGRFITRPTGASIEAIVTTGDLNGNGSEDLVWSEPSAVWLLDFAGAGSAGMLAAISNGLGKTTQFTYLSSATLSVADENAGRGWDIKLPSAIPVPVRAEVALASGEPTRAVVYRVRDGVWDGDERRFAGFLKGETRVPGVGSPGVGPAPADEKVSEAYFLAGLGADRVLRGLTWKARELDGSGKLYSEAETKWQSKVVISASCTGDNPLGRVAIKLETTGANHEGVSSPIKTYASFEHDSEGRVTAEHIDGRLDLTGDEKEVRRAFADDDLRWIRNRTCEEVLLQPGIAGGGLTLVSRSRSYYTDDGATDATQFDQLRPGVATACAGLGKGWVRRSESYLTDPRLDPAGTGGRFVEQSRSSLDGFGLPLSVYGGGVTRTLTYDPVYRWPKTESVSPAPNRTLSWTVDWDDVLGAPKSLTGPDGNSSEVAFDGLGRLVNLKSSAWSQPHTYFRYDWVAPRPRTHTWVFDGQTPGDGPRNLSGDAISGDSPGKGWRHSVVVSNGAGEDLFSATRLSDENGGNLRWIVEGWKERDARGRVIRIADPVYYAGGGLPTSEASLPPLVTKTLKYDALDRVVLQKLPNGGEKSITFKAFEQTVQSSQLAPVTSTLDGLGRILRTSREVTGMEPEEVGATYDAADRILEMSLQGGRAKHRFWYDTLGRLIAANDPDIGPRSMTYTDWGWLTSHTNGAGQAVSFAYDQIGRLTRQWESQLNAADVAMGRQASEYRFFYDQAPSGADGAGDVSALGHCANEGRNRQGRLSWVLEPHGQSCFGYDRIGRQNYSQRTIYKEKLPTAGGGTRTFVSMWARSVTSPSNLPLSIDFSDEFGARHDYDVAGRLVAIKDPGGKAFWALLEGQTGASGLAELALDAAGRILHERFGNGLTQHYGRDVLGQPTDIRVNRPFGAAGTNVGATDIFHSLIERNLYGAPTRISDVDGTGLDHSATYGYDGGARMVRATVGTGAHQYEFRYAYDGLQNMIRRAASGPRTLGLLVGEYRHGNTVVAGEIKGPRQLMRVESAKSATLCGSDAAEPAQTFDYDGAGRVIRQGSREMLFNGFDQLLQVAGAGEAGSGAIEYAYGFDGFRTLRKTPGQPEEYWFSADYIARNGKREHVLSVGNRLVARIKGAGVDGDGTGSGLVWSPPRLVMGMPSAEFAAVVFLGALGLGLAVMAALQMWRRRRWAPGIAGAVAAVMLMNIGASGCASSLEKQGQAWLTPEETYFHHGVAAGPAMLTDAGGRIVDERRHEPFGGALDSWSESAIGVGQPRAGIDYAIDPQNALNKETDRQTGWSYHGARWMEPEIARWVSPDPPVKAPSGSFVSEPWALNPYSYVLQNPAIFWDPDGNQQQPSPVFVPQVEGPPRLPSVAPVNDNGVRPLSPAAPPPRPPVSAPTGGASRLGGFLRAVGPWVVAVIVVIVIVTWETSSNRTDDAAKTFDELRSPDNRPQTRAEAAEAAPSPPTAQEVTPPGPTNQSAKPERKGAKRGPKTDENAPHNAKIREVADRLAAERNEIVAGGRRLPEVLVPTPGGEKSGRRPDIIYETPTGERRAVNVGRTKADGSPVPREQDALKDLNDRAGLPTTYVPYDR